MANKNKILIYAIIVIGSLLFTASCHRRMDKDVNDIVITCIRETIGTGDSAKTKKLNYYRPPNDSDFVQPISPEQNKLRIFLQLRYDSLKAVLDTAFAYIVLNDTLMNTQRTMNEIESAKAGLQQRRIPVDIYNWSRKNLQIIDTNYISAGIQLPVRTQLVTKPDDIRLVASFWFSRIAFNQNRDRAAVFMEYYCGNLCGYGDLILLEKKNGTWVLADREERWVS